MRASGRWRSGVWNLRATSDTYTQRGPGDWMTSGGWWWWWWCGFWTCHLTHSSPCPLPSASSLMPKWGRVGRGRNKHTLSPGLKGSSFHQRVSGLVCVSFCGLAWYFSSSACVHLYLILRTKEYTEEVMLKEPITTEIQILLIFANSWLRKQIKDMINEYTEAFEKCNVAPFSYISHQMTSWCDPAVTEVHVPPVKQSQLLYICWPPPRLALNAVLSNLSPRP